MTKILLYLAPVFLLSCSDNKKKPRNQETGKETKESVVIENYDLEKPEKFFLPDALNEVSGISFYKERGDTLYAEQDEEGRLYFLHLGDSKASHVKFGKKGDFEDVSICNEQVIMLRSDGVLFSFPFSDVRKEEATGVKEWKDILPPGEYEGLYADEKDNKIYVLCKQCEADKTTGAVTAHILQLQTDGSITKSGMASINEKEIEKLAGEKKMKFRPSALARHPQTGEWYILSSINRMLVIADTSWQIKKVYPLKASTFRQPEGIAFDHDNNLYISNEGDELSQGNVLKFVFKKSN